MDDEAIQKDETLVPQRQPMEPVYEESFGRFSRPTLEKDKQHLKTLSIFYYVLAGFSCFGALLSLLYIPLGLFFLLAMPPPPSGRPPSGPPPEFGYLFMGIGIFGLVINGTYAVLMYLCGKSLRAYKRRILIFVMAILLCMGFPGIILGIFTLVVLSRESVKELFEHGDPMAGQYEDA